MLYRDSGFALHYPKFALKDLEFDTEFSFWLLRGSCNNIDQFHRSKNIVGNIVKVGCSRIVHLWLIVRYLFNGLLIYTI